MRARLGGEVPAAGEHLLRRARRRSPPVGEQHDAVGERGGELGVVGGDDHGRRRRARAGGSASSAFARAVHAARRLVEAAPPPAARRRRGRSPAPAAGARRRRGRAGGGRRAGEADGARAPPAEASSPTRSCKVVAGVLQQQRDAPGALDAPARRLEQAGGVAQQRRLAGAVAPHQRDALAGRDGEVDAAQDRRARSGSSCHTPRSAQRRRRSPRGAPARGAARRRRGGAVAALGVEQPVRAQRRARLLDADRRRAQAGAARTAARPGVCSAGACSAAQLEERARRRVAGDRARRCSAITRSAAARQRSRRCSASTTVVPHSSLSRRSSQISSSPATGSSCDVGSSSSTSRGRPASAAPSATRCSSPPRELVRRSGRAAPRCPARARPPRPRARRRPRRRRGSPAGRRARRAPCSITTCVSGSWNSAAGDRGEIAPGPCSRVSRPPTDDAAGERRRRGSAARGRTAARSSVDLPRGRQPGEHARTRPRSIASDDVAQRRARRAGIAVGDALEARGTLIGSIPRRSANGASAHDDERARRARARRRPPARAARG